LWDSNRQQALIKSFNIVDAQGWIRTLVTKALLDCLEEKERKCFEGAKYEEKWRNLSKKN